MCSFNMCEDCIFSCANLSDVFMFSHMSLVHYFMYYLTDRCTGCYCRIISMLENCYSYHFSVIQ